MSSNSTSSAVRSRLRRSSSKDLPSLSANGPTSSASKVKVPFFKRRVHSCSESLFSSASGFENYRGVLNWGIILLVLSNFRVALDNVLKYGLLVDPFPVLLYFLEDPYRWPSACLVVGSNLYIQLTFYVETALAEGKLQAKAGFWVHLLNLVALLAIPAAVISVYHPPPWASCAALLWNTIVFLKLISYIQVNQWCREGKMHVENLSKDEDDVANGKPETKQHVESPKKQLVEYPKNLTQKDLYYFMLCPTLCYELNFPRSPRIRLRFLMRRIFEVFFLVGMGIAVLQQWIVPAVVNSLKPFQTMDLPRVVERIMKLAGFREQGSIQIINLERPRGWGVYDPLLLIFNVVGPGGGGVRIANWVACVDALNIIPNHLLWLIFFYTFFHSVLNIVAELLQFGDRHFYSDWWNAQNIQSFWQHWNVPVHRWALRHVYQPLLQSGYPRLQAQLAVFCLSAFFHEYLVSIPLHMVKCWAFLAMLGQVPLHILTKRFSKEHSHYGNTIMWLSLIVGQPVALMMYWHDYFIMHYQANS